MFHLLTAQPVQGTFIKGLLAMERGYFFPSCFRFEFCMDRDCVVNPLIVTKLMAWIYRPQA